MVFIKIFIELCDERVVNVDFFFRLENVLIFGIIFDFEFVLKFDIFREEMVLNGEVVLKFELVLKVVVIR